MRSAFPYVGGKSYLSSYIVDRLPSHDTYVEPFAGGAGVLLNKPRSGVEVLNDADRDVVHFFKVVRERPDELAQWVGRVPYSRALYDDWADAYYAGERAENDVERAGKWLFLRYSQFSGIYGRKSGFSRDSPSNDVPPSKVWKGVHERVADVAERLRGVCVESGDYAEILERYDEPDTVFYCDPPYVEAEAGRYYQVDGFDHGRFVDRLADVEGDVAVSYSDPPASLVELIEANPDEWFVDSREYRRTVRVGSSDDWADSSTERLFMNYNPDERRRFVEGAVGQESLANFGGGSA